MIITMPFHNQPRVGRVAQPLSSEGHAKLIRSGRIGLMSALAALNLMFVLSGTRSNAEPVTDQILSDLHVSKQQSCTVLRINFNIRFRYNSHFPAERGNELRIALKPIDGSRSVAEMLTRREAVRLPKSGHSPLKAVELQAHPADGLSLVLQFEQSVRYTVAQGRDAQSLGVAFSSLATGKPCPMPVMEKLTAWDTRVEAERPSLAPPSRSTTSKSTESSGQLLPKRGAGPASDTEAAKAASLLDQARAQIKAGTPSEAIHTLKKLLALPENAYSADAQELLGVAYQKNKQREEARAVYDDYLKRYPTQSGAESVRQRQAALVTAEAARSELNSGSSPDGNNTSAKAKPSTWTVSGSVSQFYIRDDSFRVVQDPSLPLTLNTDKEDHRVHRNSVLSSFDLIATWNDAALKSRFRFSGTEEHQFGTEDKELVGVSALFVETTFKEQAVMARVGRQTRNSGGVLGRFDGALVSWQSTPWVRLNVVGGSPVASRRDEPFKDDKVFLGASLDVGPFFGGVDASLFVLQQQAGDIVDRQSIGGELRYTDASKSAFMTVDYDTNLNAFNAAIFSGSWTFADKSSLHGGVDYRKSPYLSSWNALQGQSVATLYDLLKLRTQAEITQMALDRTATYSSANIGYSFLIAPKLQVNVDATAAYIDGTIASFGVDAVAASGNEYYYSAQLLGTNLFWNGDLFSMAARLADREESTTYVADFGVRLPLTPEWRINPRLVLTYRDGKTTDFTEYSVLPSVLFNYYLTKDFSFEMEVGAKRTWRDQVGLKEDNSELFFTIGYRYDFYADGQARCPFGATRC